MNALPTQKIDANSKENRSCRRRLGRRLVKALLLAMVLGLAAWPIWNWVAVPLLALPALTYWQMTGIVALIGSISMIFSGAIRHRLRFRWQHAEKACAWSHCDRHTGTRQG